VWAAGHGCGATFNGKEWVWVTSILEGFGLPNVGPPVVTGAFSMVPLVTLLPGVFCTIDVDSGDVILLVGALGAMACPGCGVVKRDIQIGYVFVVSCL
jgi:hypothetical protein